MVISYIYFNPNSFIKQHTIYHLYKPLIYLILIITLPQDTEKWFIILYHFLFIGILLDLFEGNMGLNSSSLVFIGFITPYYL